MTQVSVYRSKVDKWMGLLLLFLAVMGGFCLLIGIYHLISGNNPGASWSLLGTGILLLGVLKGLSWPVRYMLTDKELIVQSGWLKSRYPYNIIGGARPSRNLISSPALSLDRLRIDYQGRIGFLLVSPTDKEAFMRDLASRAAHLQFQDGAVVSTNS